MTDRIMERLGTLGYKEISGMDKTLTAILIQKVEQEILTDCNLPQLPEELSCVVTERVCGEFLLAKKTADGIPGLDLDACVTSISEGDVSISFDASVSPEKRLDAMIGHLMAYGRDNLAAFRCLKW